MKNSRWRKSLFEVSLFLLLAATPGLILADNSGLPDVMVGQTQVTDSLGHTFYGGMTGNEAVYNSIPIATNSSGDNLFGFNKTILDNCFSGLPLLPVLDKCFVHNQSSGSSIKVMNSRTSIDGIDKLEVAALVYPPSTVSGDVYGGLDNNFSFWGRNVHIKDDTSDATWKLDSSYSLAESQSKWGGQNYDAFTAKANLLLGEGIQIQTTDIANARTWNLQNNSNIISGPTNDTKKYPEGKVWGATDLTNDPDVLDLTGTYKYTGRGTIIIKGNLRTDPNTIIEPDLVADPNAHLGIIVLADNDTEGICTFGGNSQITAEVFCQTSFSVASITRGGTFNGAFVSRRFLPSSVSGAYIGGTNARFFYNPVAADDSPPGFRYLNLPTVKP